MDVRKEIKQYAADADKHALLWLFDRYHMASQWRFVAKSTFVQHGAYSYEAHRVWAPTVEGRALYVHLSGIEAREEYILALKMAKAGEES